MQYECSGGGHVHIVGCICDHPNAVRAVCWCRRLPQSHEGKQCRQTSRESRSHLRRPPKTTREQAGLTPTFFTRQHEPAGPDHREKKRVEAHASSCESPESHLSPAVATVTRLAPRLTTPPQPARPPNATSSTTTGCVPAPPLATRVPRSIQSTLLFSLLSYRPGAYASSRSSHP